MDAEPSADAVSPPGVDEFLTGLTGDPGNVLPDSELFPAVPVVLGFTDCPLD